MKKILTLTATFIFSLTFVYSSSPKKFHLKPGKYRQVFYLGQAQPYAGVYRLDVFVPEANICVAVIGGCEGDAFKIKVTTDDTILVMQQLFYMDGNIMDENAKNTWFANYKRKQLDKFFLEYFGITIKSRKDFEKDYKTTSEKVPITGDFSI